MDGWTAAIFYQLLWPTLNEIELNLFNMYPMIRSLVGCDSSDSYDLTVKKKGGKVPEDWTLLFDPAEAWEIKNFYHGRTYVKGQGYEVATPPPKKLFDLSDGICRILSWCVGSYAAFHFAPHKNSSLLPVWSDTVVLYFKSFLLLAREF